MSNKISNVFLYLYISASYVYLYISNKLHENKIIKSSTWNSMIIINVEKNIQDLYTEKYKTLLTKIEDGLDRIGVYTVFIDLKSH